MSDTTTAIDWDTYEPTAAVRKAAIVLFSASAADAVCFGWVPQAREALATALNIEEIALALGEHRIERTGLEGVTCRGCRELGWMSRYAFEQHQADALRQAILGSD